MASFSDYLENAVLNHVFRNTALASPATVYLGLYTVAPTDAGGGTEVTGAGYARQATAFGAPSSGAVANSAIESFTATGGNYGTVVAAALFDAVSGGNMLAWNTITSAVVNDGDTISFAISGINITLA
jgi:hypothetical protein